MDRKSLSRMIAELKLETGYVFENGTPMYEKMDLDHAKALLRALEARGYTVAPMHGNAPRLTKKAA